MTQLQQDADDLRVEDGGGESGVAVGQARLKEESGVAVGQARLKEESGLAVGQARLKDGDFYLTRHSNLRYKLALYPCTTP